MKRLVSVMLSGAMLLGLSAICFASINGRQYREQRRIREGIRSGELTRREAGRLETEQARIRMYERFARRDGYVSPRERAGLDRRLDRASRDIYRQKHDGQDRNP
ncbi:MAG TPA: hypothetical protein VFB82_10330 [Blastocatellia bacterium]|nr:hypothetical protein [Blastocatellia bacterium]